MIQMSREEFRNFVNTIEHNLLVKEKLKLCKTSQEIILLAKKYGYSITIEDLNYDKTATQFGIWFKKSRINPLNS
ncbi:Nif11-like leader peptide family natural product precursor [Prochlorococcus marinus]|uniref:Nif11 domain-containing protein n=1 Tax=Prochlorococcus marinus XMU1408 TaxID=2213228 RepID=A0A318RFW4_PROMR|nr:hypothetical protein [Prochlorococcus marinus str. XMU1408]PYE02763.1 hypothetical protein DNJ73_03140 [Prochlorococcus marinus XMU1408]